MGFSGPSYDQIYLRKFPQNPLLKQSVFKLPQMSPFRQFWSKYLRFPTPILPIPHFLVHFSHTTKPSIVSSFFQHHSIIQSHLFYTFRGLFRAFITLIPFIRRLANSCFPFRPPFLQFHTSDHSSFQSQW